VDARLLELLVCPICKGSLQYDRDAQELICPRDKLAYPIRDDIPLLLVDLARDLEAPAAAGASGAETGAEASVSDQP
jgi:uncharacterized protein YbaR (Trm112 family)